MFEVTFVENIPVLNRVEVKEGPPEAGHEQGLHGSK